MEKNDEKDGEDGILIFLDKAKEVCYHFSVLNKGDLHMDNENNTFTIVLKGEQITLTYCPAGTKMDLGYASLTERSFPVLYGKTDDKSHIVTFKLDQNSEYNIDSGLVKGE